MTGIERKLLAYSDIQELFLYLQKIDKTDSNKVFISHKIDLDSINETVLRRNIFDYKFLVYCQFQNGKIDSCIMFLVPEAFGNSTTLDILMMPLDNDEFLNESLQYIKEKLEYRGWTKIKIRPLSIQLNNIFKHVITNCKFKEEVILASLNERLNVYEYSYAFS